MLETYFGARNSYKVVRFDVAPREQFHEHQHPLPHLFFLLSGSMTEDDGHNGETMKPGSLRASKSGTTHTLEFDERDAECVAIHFSDPALGAKVGGVAQDENHAFSSDGFDLLLQRFLDHAASTSSMLLAELDILEMLAGFDEAASEDLPDWLSEAHLTLQRPENPEWSVGDLAKVVGVSREHLTRTYKRVFGVTPVVARKAHALTHAISYLHHDEMPLVDVAGETGFFDQAHLSNALKRATGFTPKQMKDHLKLRSQFSNTDMSFA